MKKAATPIIAIVGQTNVGKSSLFNLLVGSRRAITAKEAGTTRDSVAELMNLGEEAVAWLVDTAGLKVAEDEFELSIQEQIGQAIESADLIMVVIEADGRLSPKDRELAKLALKSKKTVILVGNKVDRNYRAQPSDFLGLGIKSVFLTSTTTRQGIDDLVSSLASLLPKAGKKTDESTIGVALLGRPNVGKSALFNSLSKKQKAIVASHAGTTRDVNKQIVHYHKQAIELMDTAGIRRSGKIEVGVEKFSVLKSLAAIEAADICFLLTEASEPALAIEQKIAGLVEEAGKGLVIVVSKWDLLEKDSFTRDQLAVQLRSAFDFVPWASLIFTSSETGQNVTKLLELTMSIWTDRCQKINTKTLNQWLIKAVSKHLPAGSSYHRPRLNYVAQTSTNPPTFTFFGAHAKTIHWSYRRFLNKELRQEFGYEGTALRLIFRDKD